MNPANLTLRLIVAMLITTAFTGQLFVDIADEQPWWKIVSDAVGMSGGVAIGVIFWYDHVRIRILAQRTNRYRHRAAEAEAHVLSISEAVATNLQARANGFDHHLN